jgi:Ca2+-binding RTX toxin-like protein
MTPNRISLWLASSLLVLMTMSIFSAFSASNTVEATRKTDQFFGIDIDALTPPECSHLNLQNIVAPSQGVNSTNQADLIFVSSTDWLVSGGGGRDCIIGTSATDIIFGGNGNDVILGRGGDDWLFGGGGNDYIDGEAGSDYCDGGGDPGDELYNCE